MATLEGGASFTHSLDGLVNFLPEVKGGRSEAYTLTFRTGAVEFVTSVQPRSPSFEMFLSRNRTERAVVAAFDKIDKFYKTADITPPMFAFVSLVDVAGYSVHTDPLHEDNAQTLRAADLVLPALEIMDTSFDHRHALKPTFDMLWNAFGLPGSTNFGPNGWDPTGRSRVP